jgi:glycosyltransferase involved in cell wall biosynthesis
MMNHTPVISIITVVFNDARHIEGTLQSVLNQTYRKIEYIVIDGGSTDGTLDIVGQYGSRIRLITGPDRGLYDAMNKGLMAATGEYVWYLNSGDRVYSEDTVERMVEGLREMPDVIYGGTLIIGEDGREIGDRRLKPPDPLTWRSFRKGMVVCHQSLVVRRTIAAAYDLSYKISADIDWAIRSTMNARTLQNSGLVLSRFLEGGLSGTNIKRGLRERFRIMVRYYGLFPTLLRHILFGIRLTNYYLRHRRI